MHRLVVQWTAGTKAWTLKEQDTKRTLVTDCKWAEGWR